MGEDAKVELYDAKVEELKKLGMDVEVIKMTNMIAIRATWGVGLDRQVRMCSMRKEEMEAGNFSTVDFIIRDFKASKMTGKPANKKTK